MKQRRWIALLMALCMALVSGAACAEDMEAQLTQVVLSTLDQDGLEYEYDAENGWITLMYMLDGAPGEVEVTIFLYDDMVSVVVDSARPVEEDAFERAAILTTLINSEIYYAQFRVDRDYGSLVCRSCNVMENVLPGEEEIRMLLYIPIIYMENYGAGITAVLSEGADPYEAYEACQTSVQE